MLGVDASGEAVMNTGSRRTPGWPYAAAGVVAVAVGGAVLALAGGRAPGVPVARAPAAAAAEEPLLWPFATVADAERWQQSHQAGGHSPWHLDAEATALAFTTGYLAFTEVDQVVTSAETGARATVTVGYRGAGPRPAPAAVVTLVRLGDGAGAPWEVVGATADSLTLTARGTTSPLRVEGTVSGVDESIRVQVRDPAVDAPLGEACCTPAGGSATPWAASVAFAGAAGPTLTVIASTGGHASAVARFAVTGVHNGSR